MLFKWKFFFSEKESYEIEVDESGNDDILQGIDYKDPFVQVKANGLQNWIALDHAKLIIREEIIEKAQEEA